MDYSLCYWLSPEGYECQNPATNGFCYYCYEEKSDMYRSYKAIEEYLCSLFDSINPPTLGTVIPLLQQVIHQRQLFTSRLHLELRDNGHEYHVLKLIHILQNYMSNLTAFGEDITEVHKCIQTVHSNPFVARDIDNIKHTVERYLHDNSLFVNNYETSIIKIPENHLRILWRDNYRHLYYGTLEEFARINKITYKKLVKWTNGTKPHQLVGVIVRNYLKYLVVYESRIKISKKEDILVNLTKDITRIVVIVAGKSPKHLQSLKNSPIPQGTVVIYCTSDLTDLRGVITSNKVFVIQPETTTSKDSKIESICMMCVLVYLHYNIPKNIAFHIIKGPAALIGELVIEDREVKAIKHI